MTHEEAEERVRDEYDMLGRGIPSAETLRREVDALLGLPRRVPYRRRRPSRRAVVQRRVWA